MDITTLTLEQLEAMAYRIVCVINTNQSNLVVLERRIQELRAVVPPVVPPAEPEEIV